MVPFDIVNRYLSKQALAPTTVTDNTVTNTAWIDLQGNRAIAFLLHVAGIATGGASFAVKLQHANASDFSDSADVDPVNDTQGESKAVAGYGVDATITSAYANAAFTGATPNVERKIGYRGTKRYVRAVITPSGNAAAATFAATALLAPNNVGYVA